MQGTCLSKYEVPGIPPDRRIKKRKLFTRITECPRSCNVNRQLFQFDTERWKLDASSAGYMLLLLLLLLLFLHYYALIAIIQCSSPWSQRLQHLWSGRKMHIHEN